MAAPSACWAPRKPRLRESLSAAKAGGDEAILDELTSNPCYHTTPPATIMTVLVRVGVDESRAHMLLRTAGFDAGGEPPMRSLGSQDAPPSPLRATSHAAAAMVLSPTRGPMVAAAAAMPATPGVVAWSHHDALLLDDNDDDENTRGAWAASIPRLSTGGGSPAAIGAAAMSLSGAVVGAPPIADGARKRGSPRGGEDASVKRRLF